jgi:hypothetical protein
LENSRKPILLFLKLANKGKRSNIESAFPIQTILSNQVVNELFLFIKVFHLVNEDGILKIKYQKDWM